MPKILTIGPVLAVALVLASAAMAAPALSPSYQVVGFEIGAPQGDVSPFAGFGTGTTGDRAQWRAGIPPAPPPRRAALGSGRAVTRGTPAPPRQKSAAL